MDDKIRGLQKSMEDVGARVTALEAAPTLPPVQITRPEWHGDEHMNQGTVTAASRAQPPALDKGTRNALTTPERFDLGTSSNTFVETPHSWI